jgi:acetylornithine/succinyldiaminopimelate/putrescine aminotransferase
MIAIQRRRTDAHLMAVQLAQEAGVLCKDTRGHTIRFLPPLVTPEEVLLEAVDRMTSVLARG